MNEPNEYGDDDNPTSYPTSEAVGETAICSVDNSSLNSTLGNSAGCNSSMSVASIRKERMTIAPLTSPGFECTFTHASPNWCRHFQEG